MIPLKNFTGALSSMFCGTAISLEAKLVQYSTCKTEMWKIDASSTQTLRMDLKVKCDSPVVEQIEIILTDSVFLMKANEFMAV